MPEGATSGKSSPLRVRPLAGVPPEGMASGRRSLLRVRPLAGVPYEGTAVKRADGACTAERTRLGICPGG